MKAPGRCQECRLDTSVPMDEVPPWDWLLWTTVKGKTRNLYLCGPCSTKPKFSGFERRPREEP